MGNPIYVANVGSEGKPERTEISGNFAVIRNYMKPSLSASQTHSGISAVLSFSEGKQE